MGDYGIGVTCSGSPMTVGRFGMGNDDSGAVERGKEADDQGNVAGAGGELAGSSAENEAVSEVPDTSGGEAVAADVSSVGSVQSVVPQPTALVAKGPAIPRAMIVLVGLAAGWIALQGIREIKGLLAPTLLAMTLVVTVYPMVGWLKKRGVPGWGAALAALTTLYLVIAALFFSMGFAVTQLASQSQQYSGKFQDLWRQYSPQVEELYGGKIDFTSVWERVNPEKAFSLASGLAGSLASASSALILILTVTMFMVMDTVNMPRRLEALAAIKPNLAIGMKHFATGVRQYWVVTTVFGLIVAALDYVLLLWLSIPMALTWALLSFVTNYIPTVGLILGLIPPALLALVEGGVSKMLWVILAYVLINNIIQTVIQPKFTGDAVGITATVSFLSLVFWAYVLGPLGALLAVPMTVMVKTILIDVDPSARWANAFIAADPDKEHEHVPVSGDVAAKT